MKTTKYKLQDIVIGKEGLLKGPFGSDLKKSLYVEKSSNTYKVYLQENILKQDISKGKHHITEEYFHKKMTRYLVSEGDFIVTCDGTLGKIFQLTNIKERGIISSSLLRITLNKKLVNEKFFPYFWESRIKYPLIRSHDNSVLKHLPGVNAIREFEIDLPEIDTQTKIANILCSIDSKIELNNKINKELEAMAKTLYDYWFVQFDFPDENGKPYKSSGGEMVYNEKLKREVPKGWDVKSIADLIGTNKGGDWGKENIEGNYTQKISCVRGADINGLNGLGELNPPERFILKKNSNKILEANDLIVEISGGSPTQSTGRLAFIIDETLNRFTNPVICSNFCKSFSLEDSNLLYFFVYTWNLLYDNDVLFGWEGKTSGIKNLLFDSFTEKYYIVIPNEKINTMFYEKARIIHEMKQKNLQQNQELVKLRDWLLPMLMNGQVSVK